MTGIVVGVDLLGALTFSGGNPGAVSNQKIVFFCLAIKTFRLGNLSKGGFEGGTLTASEAFFPFNMPFAIRDA